MAGRTQIFKSQVVEIPTGQLYAHLRDEGSCLSSSVSRCLGH